MRVIGGWCEFQFAERRLPTLREINDAAPDTPVFILHLYDRALLNRAALRAVGYTRDTPNPPGGEIVRDGAGEPTGLLLAQPNAAILYATLARGPKLPPDEQLNSTDALVQRFLGVKPGNGKALQLDEKWAYNIVKQVGNYGESYERNVGMGSPLKLARGLNGLWTKGGLMYPLPLR